MRKIGVIYSLAIIAVLLIAGVYFFPTIKTLERGAISGDDCTKFDLNLKPLYAETITEIVSTVANTSVFSLAFKKSHLDELGAILNKHVPPLEFVGYIFAHPQLVSDMELMSKSSLKFGSFAEGIQRGMLKEYEERCFYLRMKGFCKALGLNQDQTIAIFKQCVEEAQKKDKRAFKPFLDYLLKEKSK